MPNPYYMIDVNEILTPSIAADPVKREKDLLILKALLTAREIKACRDKKKVVIPVTELLKLDRHKDSSNGF